MDSDGPENDMASKWKTIYVPLGLMDHFVSNAYLGDKTKVESAFYY